MSKTSLMLQTQGEHIRRAEQLAKDAKSLIDLRQAQAVLLTMAHGLNLEEAAKVIGRSPSWVCNSRKVFLSGEQRSRSPTHGGRRNQILSPEEEVTFMEEVCKRYKSLGGLVYPRMGWGGAEDVHMHQVVQDMLEEKTGRLISSSTAFALMARVGKNKFKEYSTYDWRKYSTEFSS